jgi:signal transduction histidine kinase
MSIPSSIPNNSALSDPTDNHSSSPETDTTPPATETGPFPIMPSQTFFNLANLQFELLSNSIQFKDQPTNENDQKSSGNEPERQSKIKSIALYMPQENPKTGQLEFMPSLVYPSHPKSERLFIASDAQSGVPPTLPPTLTQLPGFSHASTLIPAYPFIHTDGGSVETGVVPEEVFCDLKEGSKGALSLPLRSGQQTIGILLCWGAEPPQRQFGPLVSTAIWSKDDKNQISRVGETLALALEMDSERFRNRIQSENLRVAIADNLHQVKNPVQALRTFSKLLQRNLATDGGGYADLGRLADDISIQSERVVDLLRPFDSILNSMENTCTVQDSMNMVGLNSYQRLLAPTERRELVLVQPRDKHYVHIENKSMQTDTYKYLGSLSKSEEPMAKPVQVKSNDIMRGSRAKDERRVEVQMSFIPDVLQPILSPSKTLSADLGIEMKIVGNGEDTELPGVSVNPKLLQEAVVNVLDNAIKYVSYGENGVQGIENSNPKIRVTLAPNGDDIPPGVTILIEDNGPGIRSEDEKVIFERGYRGEYTNSLTKGSGIGLDISRELIAAMGGSLELLTNDHSRYLQGTVMRFILYRKKYSQIKYIM